MAIAKKVPAVQKAAAKPAETKIGGKTLEELLSQARERHQEAHNKDLQNQIDAIEDLNFLANVDDAQWDPDSKALREAERRPIITINLLPQFTRQVTGDIRQMRPAIKVMPVDDHGDVETAKIREGLIRYIEGRSVAKSAYYRGADSQVACGIGHWRVVTEYAADSTFNQEIGVAPIEDQTSVVWDPDAIEQNRTDADYCFVPVDMNRLKFRDKFPDATSEGLPSGIDVAHWQGWFTDDHVRVAEYWFKVPEEKTLMLASNGTIIDLTDASPEELAAAQMRVAEDVKAGLEAQIAKRPGFCVYRGLMTAAEWVDPPKKWPGRYIPIIRVPGNEIQIGRRTVRFGIVRFARAPARLYNYFASQQAEVMALQPKAPFVGTEKNFDGHEDEWEESNSANRPFLTYNPDPVNGGAAPKRAEPPVASSGIELCQQRALNDLKGSIGIYEASLGAKGNETSGKAITARQREGDTGSFIYVENFSQAIAHTATVINDLIPHVYDNERTIRISGEDGTVDKMKINALSGQDEQGNNVYANDMAIGAYDVVMQMGPSYSTRREEAREGMTALLQSVPDLAPAILDLIAAGQDWPMADDIRERVEVIAPAAIQELLRKKRGEQPPPPSPEDEAKAQAEGDIAEAQKIEAEAKLTAARAALLKAQSELAAAHLPAPAPVAPGAPGAAPGAAAVAGESPAKETAEDTRVAALQTAVHGLAEAVDEILARMAGPGPAAAPGEPAGLPAPIPGPALADPAALPV